MLTKDNISPITATRQNHALEHATIAIILQRKGVHTRVAGRATTGGFHLYGSLPTKLVKEAAYEALERLRSGEGELALSPFCGTNIAVAGALAGLVSLVAVGNRNRLLSLPRVLVASIGAVLAAQPLGKLAQKHLTTTSDMSNLQIVRISRSGLGPWTAHKIETTRI